jgi:hypothetical protein
MVIRSNLSPPPTFPATFWDLVPFRWAGGLALIFTALLVLLVEDDSNDSKLLGERQSQLTSFQRRFVGLSEKEREWSMLSQSSYYAILLFRGTSRVPQLRSPSPPRPAATSTRCFQKIIWCVSTALVPYSSSCPCTLRPSISLILDLIAQTLAYEPITHTSIIGSTHAIYGEVDHALTCTYPLLSYPICQLGSHSVTLFPMTL